MFHLKGSGVFSIVLSFDVVIGMPLTSVVTVTYVPLFPSCLEGNTAICTARLFHSGLIRYSRTHLPGESQGFYMKEFVLGVPSCIGGMPE